MRKGNGRLFRLRQSLMIPLESTDKDPMVQKVTETEDDSEQAQRQNLTVKMIRKPLSDSYSAKRQELNLQTLYNMARRQILWPDRCRRSQVRTS